MLIAPGDIESSWSVEELWYPRPVGVHTPWLHMSPAHMQELLRYCPDIEIIIPKGYLLAYEDSSAAWS